MHDHVYTALLGVLSILTAILILFTLKLRLQLPIESRPTLFLPVIIYTCFLAAMLPVLAIRISFPVKRRWPTFALNIALLMYVPLGTVLGAYGLFRADKRLRSSNTNTDQSSPSPDQPHSLSGHDQMYTALLGFLAFFIILGIAIIAWIRQLPSTSDETRSAILIPITIYSVFLAATLAILLIRIFAPSIRRWPTFALNIILLLFFPIGTALAINAFAKVDKRTPPI